MMLQNISCDDQCIVGQTCFDCFIFHDLPGNEYEPLLKDRVFEPVLDTPVMTESIMPELTEPIIPESIESIVTESIMTESIMTDSIVTESIMTDSIVTESIMTDSIVTKSIMTEPITIEPFPAEPEHTEEPHESNLAIWLSLCPEFNQHPEFIHNCSRKQIRRAKYCGSLSIFKKFVRYNGNKVDTSGILSRKCYEEWLVSRIPMPKCPEESFRKTLSWILSKNPGSKIAFSIDVRDSLVQVLSEPRVWPCFENRRYADGRQIMIGAKGIRILKKWHDKTP